MAGVNPNVNYMPIIPVNTGAPPPAFAGGQNATRANPLDLALPANSEMGLNTFLNAGNILNLQNTDYVTNEYSLSSWDKDIFENYKKFKMHSDPKGHIIEANQKHIALRQEYVKKYEDIFRALMASGNPYTKEEAKRMAYQAIQGELSVKMKILHDKYVPASSSSEMNQMLGPAYALMGNDARVSASYDRYNGYLL